MKNAERVPKFDHNSKELVTDEYSLSEADIYKAAWEIVKSIGYE